MRFLALLLTALTTVNPVWTQTNAIRPSADADRQPALRVRIVDDPGPALPNSTAIKGYAVQITDSSGAPIADAAVALRLPEEGATGHFGSGLRAWVAYTDPAGVARFPVIQWEGSVGAAELRVTAAKGSVHAGLLVQQRVGAQLAGIPPPIMAKVQEAKVQKAPPPPPAPEIAMEAPQPDAALADTLPMPVVKSGAAMPKDGGHTQKPESVATVQTQEPAVSITNSGTGAGQGGSRKKWLIIAAIGAAAGIGVLLAVHGHGSSGKATSTGVTIGSPTITVSH